MKEENVKSEYQRKVDKSLIPTCNIMGVNIAAINMNWLLKYIDENLSDIKGDYICVSNVHAYRHQLKLVMSIDEAVKLLGNRPDPIQTEAKQYIGKEIIAIPPEFPEAFPCSIKVGEKTYFDYILLRTEEILDDGT